MSNGVWLNLGQNIATVEVLKTETSINNFSYEEQSLDKIIQVKFDIENEIEDEDITPLYVEKINSTDSRAQIELKMCSIENLNTWWQLDKKNDLTELQQLDVSEKELYTLSANEEKGVTFDADKWELPQNVSNKKIQYLILEQVLHFL